MDGAGYRPRQRGVPDEHTVLIRVGNEGPNLALGDKPLLIPGHIDPTINLHDVIVVSRNDVVIDLWPIEARGAVLNARCGHGSASAYNAACVRPARPGRDDDPA